MFFTFCELYEWYQIVQSTTNVTVNVTVVEKRPEKVRFSKSLPRPRVNITKIDFFSHEIVRFRKMAGTERVTETPNMLNRILHRICSDFLKLAVYN